MTFGEKLKKYREDNHLTQEQLALKVGTSKQVISRYENNLRTPKITVAKEYSKKLNISFSYLINDSKDKEFISNLDVLDINVYNIPVYESVSAGFGAAAVDNIVDYVQLPFKCKSAADDTICIRVKGDSMSPKIEDGDLIQVHKQSSVDSGDIAVVLIDGMEGLVKKVEYTQNSITLISFNPYYPPKKFNEMEIQKVSVVGKVKRIIRDM